MAGSAEYMTPEYIWRPALEIMPGSSDRFTLDPCSNSKDNPNIPAEVHYTIDDNGLLKHWTGNIFVNPPFSKGLINQFVEKIIESYKKGAVIIAITHANTSSTWASELLEPASVCFPYKRVNYLLPDGTVKKGADFDSMIVCLARNHGVHRRFNQIYKKLGVVKA